jgi:hypothetical protein
VSRLGNDQHNPGEPLHWAKEKSTDEADALARHLIDRGKMDSDGVRHSAKVAWRALALLQREIDAERALPPTITVDECPRLTLTTWYGSKDRLDVACAKVFQDAKTAYSATLKRNPYGIYVEVHGDCAGSSTRYPCRQCWDRLNIRTFGLNTAVEPPADWDRDNEDIDPDDCDDCDDEYGDYDDSDEVFDDGADDEDDAPVYPVYCYTCGHELDGVSDHCYCRPDRS